MRLWLLAATNINRPAQCGQHLVEGGPIGALHDARFRKFGIVNCPRGLCDRLRPVVGLGDDVEFWRRRRVANPPEFDFEPEEPETFVRDPLSQSSVERCSSVKRARSIRS
jgi:hypothetical protein